jgi:hypothetical protein
MLDGIDETIIERMKRDSEEFRRLLEEHEQYELDLTSYNNVRFLTSEQEIPYASHLATT